MSLIMCSSCGSLTNRHLPTDGIGYVLIKIAKSDDPEKPDFHIDQGMPVTAFVCPKCSQVDLKLGVPR